MARRKELFPGETVKKELAFGLTLDLDETAFNGRKILYDVCEGALSQKKTEISHGLFCRFFLDYPLEEALSRMTAAQGRKLSVDKLAADIRNEYAERITAEANHPDADLAALMAEAMERKIAVGALSFLPEEKARVLLKRIVPDDSASLLIIRDGFVMTREAWLRVAGMIRVNPRCCLALTSCAMAFRAALAAGMRCAVAANEFTGFQDFAGAEMVAESVKELGPKKLIALLQSRTAEFRQG